MTRRSRDVWRRVFLRELRLDAYIGVYDHEQGRAQPIVVDVEIDVAEPDGPVDDRFDQVLCYNKVARGVRALVAEGHIALVETLAERIAALALEHPLARAVTVTVAKSNAVEDAAAAGVSLRREIEA